MDEIEKKIIELKDQWQAWADKRCVGLPDHYQVEYVHYAAKMCAKDIQELLNKN